VSARIQGKVNHLISLYFGYLWIETLKISFKSINIWWSYCWKQDKWPCFYSATACNATHGIAKVFLSVCLSVRRVDYDKTKETCPHCYTTWKTINLSFLKRKMVGGATPCTWNIGSNWSFWSENADFQLIFARNTSAVTPSENS